MMKNQILLVNDMAGYGKVALSAMMPILTHMGLNIYNLPTALVSNTLDYGKFEILDTTDYMKNTIEVWEQLGFSFDAVATGFIVNHRQACLLADYCRKQQKKGSIIFCDPIMGDNGKLYNGITLDTVRDMLKLVATADVVFPNYTEAAFLIGTPCENGAVSQEQAKTLLDKMRKTGAKSIVITSINIEENHMVAGYDAVKQENFFLPYEYIPVRIPGTGDIFSAIVIGELLNGKDLKRSVERAISIVGRLIEKNRNNLDKFKGIALESCMEVFDE